MPRWIRRDSDDTSEKKRWIRIRCFTCEQDIASKQAARSKHRGHDVHYVDREGNVDE